MPLSSPRVRRVLSRRVWLSLISLIAVPSLTISARPAGTAAAGTHRPIPATPISANASASHPKTTTIFNAADWDQSAVGTIDSNVFDLALGAASCAVRSGDVVSPSTLAVIDYSKPSTSKRMWVYDLRAHHLLYEELVAHGQGSGENVPTRFSNEPETHRSSLGLFVTEDTYVGKNGYSLRLNGLEAGFNDRALERAIVMHGAP